MGENFTLRNVTRRGIIDDVTASEMFAAGGAIPSEPISVTFKTATFSPDLTPGERITARSKNYTVRQVTRDEISITLVCEHTAKR
jgi:hypothetical protein